MRVTLCLAVALLTLSAIAPTATAGSTGECGNCGRPRGASILDYKDDMETLNELIQLSKKALCSREGARKLKDTLSSPRLQDKPQISLFDVLLFDERDDFSYRAIKRVIERFLLEIEWLD